MKRLLILLPIAALLPFATSVADPESGESPQDPSRSAEEEEAVRRAQEELRRQLLRGQGGVWILPPAGGGGADDAARQEQLRELMEQQLRGAGLGKQTPGVGSEGNETPRVLDDRVLLPTDPDVEDRFERLRVAAGNGAWLEVCRVAQEILEGDPGRSMVAGGDRIFHGVHSAARRFLIGMPPEGKDAYMRLFGATADAQLMEGIQAGDLTRVARTVERFPVTEAASLGREFLARRAVERGDANAAIRWILRLEETAGFGPESADLRLATAERAEDREALLRLAARLDAVSWDGAAAIRERCLAAIGRMDAGTREGGGFLPDGRGPFRLAWRNRLPHGRIPVDWRRVVPRLSDDLLAVGTEGGLFAFDPRSGKLLWRTEGLGAEGWEAQMRSRRYGGPLVAGLGAEMVGLLYRPDADASRVVSTVLHRPVRWNDRFDYPTELPVEGLAACAREGGRLLWTAHDRLAERDGPAVWDRVSLNGAPLLHDGRVYVAGTSFQGDFGAYAFCFDATDGTPLWETYLGHAQQEMNYWGYPVREAVASPVTLIEGRLYVCTNLGVAACLDAATGRVEWAHTYERIPQPPGTDNRMGHVPQARLSGTFFTAPIPTPGGICFAPMDSASVWNLDRITGRTLWISPIQSRPGGTRYLLGTPEWIFATGSAETVGISVRTGEIGPVLRIGYGERDLPLRRAGDLLVGVDDRGGAAYDLRTLKRIGDVRLPIDPSRGGEEPIEAFAVDGNRFLTFARVGIAAWQAPSDGGGE